MGCTLEQNTSCLFTPTAEFKMQVTLKKPQYEWETITILVVT